MLEAGATGYLLKDTAPEDFISAVHATRRGRPYLSHQFAVLVAMLGSRKSESMLGTVPPPASSRRWR
ncbi:response regulator [Arenibaculum pallidiluteum]|uniref:hypothetical protein n=1 Tax=Arenibaculum pallidiluteum TaxID=2812559 RepID=UPI001F441021|nr:hypothetical protein [Arenibaculum pallidiluteum]